MAKQASVILRTKPGETQELKAAPVRMADARYLALFARFDCHSGSQIFNEALVATLDRFGSSRDDTWTPDQHSLSEQVREPWSAP